MTESTFVPRSVRLYFVSFLIVGMALSVLGPALTDLREQSGADIADIGILFVGLSAGYLVGSFTGGRLFDRFNGHRVSWRRSRPCARLEAMRSYWLMLSRADSVR